MPPSAKDKPLFLAASAARVEEGDQEGTLQDNPKPYPPRQALHFPPFGGLPAAMPRLPVGGKAAIVVAVTSAPGRPFGQSVDFQAHGWARPLNRGKVDVGYRDIVLASDQVAGAELHRPFVSRA